MMSSVFLLFWHWVKVSSAVLRRKLGFFWPLSSFYLFLRVFFRSLQPIGKCANSANGVKPSIMPQQVTTNKSYFPLRKLFGVATNYPNNRRDSMASDDEDRRGTHQPLPRLFTPVLTRYKYKSNSNSVSKSKSNHQVSGPNQKHKPNRQVCGYNFYV